MKDRLEKFVQDNREEFDVFEPRQELWQQICHELPNNTPEKETKVIKFNFGDRASFSADFFFMRVAAAIILLLGCGLTIFLMKQQTPDTANTLAANTTLPSVSAIAPELPEVEAYYVSQIEAKKSELSDYDLKVLGLDEQQVIDKELARLDSSYNQLKKQLYTSPNTDEIVGSLIQNLQIRIKVLNRQLEVLQNLEKMKQEPIQEPQKDETTNV
ncbi:hypothetical protein POKO110462_04555 [Pontibacter korlensis]|uniref:Anti-sigma factor n=1 Tax=Pontibacter korlensis TaxID=400092 RepID=A0A0E3UW93_9BACT|nr:hypothetical protein [Pontibacter korlensis]AKD03197.1 hypothetical protein PKOR_08730 [Pontibacter korlensis]